MSKVANPPELFGQVQIIRKKYLNPEIHTKGYMYFCSNFHSSFGVFTFRMV